MKQSRFEVFDKWEALTPKHINLRHEQLDRKARNVLIRRMIRFANNIKKHLPGGRVVDIGCGFGMLVSLLNRKGIDAWGLEPSEKALAISMAPKKVKQGSVYDLDEGFDGAVLMEVLEHLQWPEMALQSVARHCGHLWLSTPAADPPSRKPKAKGHQLGSAYHLREWSPECLQEFIEGCSPYRLIIQAVIGNSIEAHYIRS